MLVRIQKILSEAGICSRRKAEEYIKEGKVSVNGKVVEKLGLKVDPAKDQIFFKRRPIKSERKVYLILNKPKGYVCTLGEYLGEKKITDLVKGVKERVFPVGRLDKDTEGLILLTNDGDFANKLMHPSYEVNKTYEVVLDRGLDVKDKKRLEGGIILDNKKTAKAGIVLRDKKAKRIAITIHEGRKRQIRRMFLCLKYRVSRLKRYRYGHLTLEGLKLGQYRFLKKWEVDKFIT